MSNLELSHWGGNSSCPILGSPCDSLGNHIRWCRGDCPTPGEWISFRTHNTVLWEDLRFTTGPAAQKPFVHEGRRQCTGKSLVLLSQSHVPCADFLLARKYLRSQGSNERWTFACEGTGTTMHGMEMLSKPNLQDTQGRNQSSWEKDAVHFLLPIRMFSQSGDRL